MKALLAIAVLFLASVAAYPQARKSCKELKEEIAKKIEANSVNSYSLEIVEKDKVVTEGAVVGFCDGGTKKIVYIRAAAPPQPPPAKPAKP